MRRLEGYRVVRPQPKPTQLEAEGWTLRQTVPGFRMVNCVRRSMDGPGAPESETTEPVLQTIYSDGLTYVSLFIEAYNPQRHLRPILASVGATHTLMRQQGDWWITVMGDVPIATLKSFANGLERKQ